MADNPIGVARLDLPDILSPGFITCGLNRKERNDRKHDYYVKQSQNIKRL